MFARGSGQDLGADELGRFIGQVTDRLEDAVSYNTYELGTEAVGGFQYPAAKIGKDSWDGSGSTPKR